MSPTHFSNTKMEEATDSGLSTSPTLEEDSLAYCLELQGLDRALLHSVAASVGRSVQIPRPMAELWRRLPVKGEEVAAKQADFSLFGPGLHHLSEPRRAAAWQFEDVTLTGAGEMFLERARSISDAGYGRAWTSTAEMYRLSFVDVGESSSNSGEEICPLPSPPPERVCGQAAAETRDCEKGRLTERHIGLEHSVSEAELQYDDEEIDQSQCNRVNGTVAGEPSPMEGDCADDGALHAITVAGAATATAKERATYTEKLSKIPTLDHSSSPLYNLSIQQLSQIASLLEEKLQGCMGLHFCVLSL